MVPVTFPSSWWSVLWDAETLASCFFLINMEKWDYSFSIWAFSCIPTAVDLPGFM